MRHWSQFIIGGSEVEDFSQFRYQLSMRYVEVHVCGASIIATNWALSAGNTRATRGRIPLLSPFNPLVQRIVWKTTFFPTW
jgi:hypothetical protein